MKKMVLFLGGLFMSIGCFSMESQNEMEACAKCLTKASIALFQTVCAHPFFQTLAQKQKLLKGQVQITHSYIEGIENQAVTLDRATKEFNDILFQLFGKDDVSSPRYVDINHLIDLALDDQEDARNVMLIAYNSDDLDKITAGHTKTDMVYAIAERVTQKDVNDLKWRQAFYAQAWTDIKDSPQKQHDFLWFLVDDVKKWSQEKKGVLSLLKCLQNAFGCKIIEIKVKDEYKTALSELLLTIAAEILKNCSPDEDGKMMLKKSKELGNGVAADYIQHEYPDLIQ